MARYLGYPRYYLGYSKFMPPTRVARRPTRLRRSRDEARSAILEVAARHLREGGPQAVRVQRVAADLGMTDAAIHHHFGSRQGLLEALLIEAGRRLRRELAAALPGQPADPAALRRAAEIIGDVYATQGYARLALWLSMAGVESAGRGLFAPLVDAVQRVRLEAARARGMPRPRRRNAQRDVALLNVALAGEPLFGGAFLRSVGLDDDPESQAGFRRWLVVRLARLLEGEAADA